MASFLFRDKDSTNWFSQHLIGVHRIAGQTKKTFTSERNEWVRSHDSEPLLTVAESHIEKHTSFLDMLLGGENLTIELKEKATQGELKAILELCFNMKEGNLMMPKRMLAEKTVTRA